MSKCRDGTGFPFESIRRIVEARVCATTAGFRDDCDFPRREMPVRHAEVRRRKPKPSRKRHERPVSRTLIRHTRLWPKGEVAGAATAEYRRQNLSTIRGRFFPANRPTNRRQHPLRRPRSVDKTLSTQRGTALNCPHSGRAASPEGDRRDNRHLEQGEGNGFKRSLTSRDGSGRSAGGAPSPLRALII
jgi:hypothetical protein